MPLSEPQRAIVSSPARWRVAACGRRFGKSFVGVREMARFASQPKRKVWYVAPTYRMSKQIIWQPLKEKLIEARWAKKFNEQDLTAHLKNGSTISLRGADNPDSLRGVGLHFLVIDEAADVREESWTQVLRPTLSDTGGSALFLGTPKGRNWFHALWLRGQNGEDNWASWQFTTVQGGNVPPEEVDAAKHDLDELTYRAEYEADFVSFLGRCYEPFNYNTHCTPLPYDPQADLIFALDFNYSPGVAAVCQERLLPNGKIGTAVIGEVWIPRGSSTPAVCRKLIDDWSHHHGRIFVYGDATGAAQGSSRIAGSDWDLARATLLPAFRDQVYFKVPRANPQERVRINAVNTRLLSAAGEVRLMVDPVKAPNVVKDLEGVQLLEGGSGQIDKKADPMRSHISDALGYYIFAEFPIVERKMTEGRMLLG